MSTRGRPGHGGRPGQTPRRPSLRELLLHTVLAGSLIRAGSSDTRNRRPQIFPNLNVCPQPKTNPETSRDSFRNCFPESDSTSAHPASPSSFRSKDFWAFADKTLERTRRKELKIHALLSNIPSREPLHFRWPPGCPKAYVRAAQSSAKRSQNDKRKMTTTAAKQARSKDFIRRDELTLKHLPLVTAIAARIRESLPVHVDLDDLVHAGVLGLFDAANKYESDKQVAFPAYAKHRIRGAILDSLRDLDWASRDIRRRQKQMEQVTRELTAKLQRTPTDAELAVGMGVSAERCRQLLVELRHIHQAAAQNHKIENDDQELLEPPCAVENHPDRIYARTEIRNRLAAAMASLPRRYQKVITLYYDRDMSMKEIGAALGVNESRVSQIHKSALTRMQASLHQTGIQSPAVY